MWATPTEVKSHSEGGPLGTGLVLWGAVVGFVGGTDRFASLLGHLRQAVPKSLALDGRV